MEINCRALVKPKDQTTIGTLCYIRSVITLSNNNCKKHKLTIKNSLYHKEFDIQNNIKKTSENHLYAGLGTISFKKPRFDILLYSKHVSEIQALFSQICTYNAAVSVKMLPVTIGERMRIMQNTPLTMVKSTTISRVPESMSLVVVDYSSCIKKSKLSNELKSIMIMEGAIRPTTPLDTLSTLENLQKIYITNNCIDVIPESFGNLRLFEVTLINNNFGKNFNWNWLKRKTIQNSLLKLDLSQNKINVFPKAILNCTKLKELRLHKNSIRRIPYEIRCLKSLTVLDVSDNILEAIPHSLERLNLTFLKFSGNAIQKDNVKPIYIVNKKFPSLLLLASRAVTDFELKFNEKTLPQTLIDILLQAPICYCGKLTFYDYSVFVSCILECLVESITESESSPANRVIQQLFSCSQECLMAMRFLLEPSVRRTTSVWQIYHR